MRLVKMFLAFLLVFILVLPVTTSASMVDDSKSIMTPEEYSNYLLDLSITDPGALEVLNDFNILSSEEQITFLDFLYSGDYLELLDTAISGSVVEKNYKLDDVTVSTETLMTTASAKRAEAKATVDIGVLGLTTTKFHTTLVWEYSGSKATKLISVTQMHSNYNPAVWVTEKGTVKNGITNGTAYGISNFEMRATGSLGFWSYTLKHEIKAGAPSTRQHKMTTTHPNIDNWGWHDF